MSDDAITSFLQSNSAIETKTSLDKPLENQVQTTDFKEVISQEEKKLSAGRRQSQHGNHAEDGTSKIGVSSAEDVSEASESQKVGQLGEISGNSLPNLSLHDGALAVGRVIYTSKDVAVTSESLSKFMARQGLVNESLHGNADLRESGSGINEEPALTTGQAVLAAEHDTNFGISEKIPGRPTGEDAVSQLAVKQVINTRGAIVLSKSERFLGQGLSPQTVIGQSSDKFGGDQAQMVDGKMLMGKTMAAGDLRPTAEQSQDGVDSSKKPVARGEALSIAQQFANEAAKTALDINQAREAGSLKQQFQNEAKSAAMAPEKLLDELTLKIKDGTEDNLTREQAVVTKGGSEAKKLENNGHVELQRFLANAQKAPESSSDRPSSSLLNQMDVNEASIKGHRDLSQYTTQEAAHSDSGQNRVEFKGALRDAQRLVASSTYNNLTDSYESWSSRFGEVLANRIAGYINKENWSVQLRMNPASLGEISLEIDFTDKGLEGRFGSNEESTRQLLHDTLPKLRLALRDILEENQGLKFDVSDFGNSRDDNEPEKKASPELVEEINFESEVLLGRTLDASLNSVVGLDILV